MSKILKRGMALLIALVLCVSFLPTLNFYADAATVDYVYDSTGKYIYNWGTRGETATFLSPNAEAFYTGSNEYDDLAALAGGTGTSDASKSALFSALQSLMKNAHKTVQSYNATREFYQYTDCQNSAKDSTAISSFYSGKAIGPAWDSGATWNREHTWPDSKGLGGSDENDIMMLRPTAKSENGARSNKAYGKSSSYYNPNSESNGALDLRGDVSRIFLYQYVRWNLASASTVWGTSGVMENLDVLLEWMEADPVDTWELGRNDSVQSITGTRNVFVDYPELAFSLFGEEIPNDMATPSGEASDNGCEHNYVAGTPVDATCTEGGYTLYTCTICSKSYKDNITAKNGHNFVDGSCDVCGAAEARLPVTGETVAIYAPAYNKALSAEKVSTYYNKGVDVEDDFDVLTDAEKWTAIVNNDGSYSFVSLTGKKLAMADSNASLNDEGANDAWTVTAKSGAENIYYLKNTVRGNYLEWYAAKDNWSTYSTTSLSDLFEISFYIFDDCDHEYSAVMVDPTCTEEGYTTYTCDLCDVSYTANIVDAYGHDYDEDGFCVVCGEEEPEEAKYTIHFLVPAGVAAVGSMVSDASGITLPTANAPAGYTFLGWSEAAVENKATKPTYLEAGDDFVPTADTVLYALYSYEEEGNGGGATSGSVSISFTSTANRTSYSTTKQVWQQNGITVTNNKAKSTSNVGNYSNPGRFYKSSEVIIEYPGMTKLEINSAGLDNKYIAWNTSFSDSNATASVSNKITTITFKNPVDSFKFASMSAQCRAYSITVHYQIAGGASVTYYTTTIDDECAHESVEFVDGVDADCTESGKEPDLYCADCDEVLIKGAVIAAKGHVAGIVEGKDATCTEEGLSEGSNCKRCDEILTPQETIPALGHADKNNDNICDRCETAVDLNKLETSKGTLTGTYKMGYNIPVSFDTVPADAEVFGALVWREGTDEANATDIVFEDGNTTLGITNIAIYGIKNVFNIKPYVKNDAGTAIYGEAFTASYLEWLLMYKDNTDANKANAVAQINKILDIYYAATGEVAYEGQAVPQFEALDGTFNAVTPMSVEGDSEMTVKAAKPVQGSIVNGKLRVNLDYGTKTGTFGVLVYKSGNAYDLADVSNANANIVFEEGAMLSVDISGIAVANYAKQYTFIPYVVNGEDVEYGNVIKVSYADFIAYALNLENAKANKVATVSCELYKALYGANLCEAAQ